MWISFQMAGSLWLLSWPVQGETLIYFTHKHQVPFEFYALEFSLPCRGLRFDCTVLFLELYQELLTVFRRDGSQQAPPFVLLESPVRHAPNQLHL